MSLCHSVSLCLCVTLSGVYSSVSVSLCLCVTVSLCHSVSVSLCHCVTPELTPGSSVTVSVCHCVTVLLCHCVTLCPLQRGRYAPLSAGGASALGLKPPQSDSSCILRFIIQKPKIHQKPPDFTLRNSPTLTRFFRGPKTVTYSNTVSL